ncbi:hypothetical protein I3843_12G046400 [Carya illinoinensis]|nr:hypothetical protein I3843_12G046400 [Carya illinoinensis]
MVTVLPSFHCNIKHQCGHSLRRNGPPEKPVLCNACGSWWRTKGTLANYTPLHARQNLMKVKLLKRKQKSDNIVVASGVPDYNQGFRKMIDEDTSNRSSSGSAISNLESCAQFSSADASELTGPSQSMVWDTTVPSRKRTFVNRPKPSPSGMPMVSVEIGHGSVLLIRHPSSITRDEESEASLLSIDNKQFPSNEAYSYFDAPSWVFDISVSGAKSEYCKILKRLALFDLMNSI